jgi:DNA polymerase V
MTSEIHFKRGGWRGGGRPKGSGLYQEQTKPIRVPISKIDAVRLYLSGATSTTESSDTATTSPATTSPATIQQYPLQIPLYLSKIPAGFPSPADDYVDTHLDLNSYLIPRPASTFLVRAIGDSMIEAGIFSNDILIVDRSLTPSHGKIVIAALEGEFTVKRLHKTATELRLMPANSAYTPIDIHDHPDCEIWGVVIHVIHAV